MIHAGVNAGRSASFACQELVFAQFWVGRGRRKKVRRVNVFFRKEESDLPDKREVMQAMNTTPGKMDGDKEAA